MSNEYCKSLQTLQTTQTVLVVGHFHVIWEIVAGGYIGHFLVSPAYQQSLGRQTQGFRDQLSQETVAHLSLLQFEVITSLSS